MITKTSIYVCYFLFLAVILSAKGQETAYDGYQIIPYVIALDTIPVEFTGLKLHRRILRGEITKEDSIKIMLKYGKRPLILVDKARNKVTQEILAVDYLDTKEISQYLGRDTLLKVLESIQLIVYHPEKLKEQGITIITEKTSKPHHYFSSPLRIENNRFIIFHLMLAGVRNGRSEIIIYCIDENENVEIEKIFLRWEH